MFYYIFIFSVVATAEMFNSSFNQSVYSTPTTADANITSFTNITADANITTVVANNSSSLKNENVSTQQFIFIKNYYCNQKILLYNKINRCNSRQYCCRINIFESQFNLECSSKNISNTCIALKK